MVICLIEVECREDNKKERKEKKDKTLYLYLFSQTFRHIRKALSFYLFK